MRSLLVLLLVLPGALFGLTDPEFPFAIAYSKCAPWDGPAVGIILMKTKEGCPPPSFPYTEISLWKELPITAPKKIELKEGTSLGSAVLCKERGNCESLSATIEIGAFEKERAVSGSYRLVSPNGNIIEGKFEAPWCDRNKGPVACG